MIVKRAPAGARLSYGLRYELERPGTHRDRVVGYADGVPRKLGLAAARCSSAAAGTRSRAP